MSLCTPSVTLSAWTTPKSITFLWSRNLLPWCCKANIFLWIFDREPLPWELTPYIFSATIIEKCFHYWPWLVVFKLFMLGRLIWSKLNSIKITFLSKSFTFQRFCMNWYIRETQGEYNHKEFNITPIFAPNHFLDNKYIPRDYQFHILV